MSKIKLRKQNKIFANTYGIIERAGTCHWLDRKIIKRNTLFDCKLNSLFIEAINLYNTLPFAIHKLWIEIIDDKTSQLLIAWNVINQRTIHDLGPFWEIYYSLKYERGLCDIMHYFPKVAEAMEHLTNVEQKYQVPKIPKENYMEYRKKQSEKKYIDWAIKKDEKAYSKLSKKRKRELSKKTKYTWKD